MPAKTRRSRLPVLDVDTIAAAAAERARKALHDAQSAKGASHRTVAEFAATLTLESEAQVKEKSTYRDKLMLHLVVREGYPAMQVARAAGTSRAWMLKMLDKALGKGDGSWTMAMIPKDADARAVLAVEKKVRNYPKAAEELPAVAAEVVKHKAVIEAAMPVRDAAAKHLMEQEGVTREEVARLIGRNPTRVTHLTDDRPIDREHLSDLERDAYTRVCPRCAAAPGDDCRTGMGARVAPHAARQTGIVATATA